MATDRTRTAPSAVGTPIPGTPLVSGQPQAGPTPSQPVLPPGREWLGSGYAGSMSKPTHVSATERQGTPVNPGHTSGNIRSEQVFQGETEYMGQNK
jgi:hypothetical protein